MFENLTDLERAELYVINGIICIYFGAGKRPTAKQVRENFNFPTTSKVTDEQINEVIKRVARYY